MKRILIALIIGCAIMPARTPSESADHLRARLIVRFCAGTDSELVIDKVISTFKTCRLADIECEFAICRAIRDYDLVCRNRVLPL